MIRVYYFQEEERRHGVETIFGDRIVRERRTRRLALKSLIFFLTFWGGYTPLSSSTI